MGCLKSGLIHQAQVMQLPICFLLCFAALPKSRCIFVYFKLQVSISINDLSTEIQWSQGFPSCVNVFQCPMQMALKLKQLPSQIN